MVSNETSQQKNNPKLKRCLFRDKLALNLHTVLKYTSKNSFNVAKDSIIVR